MEEIDTKSRDIMIIYRTIFYEKIRIILAYFNYSKEVEGSKYEANRELQSEWNNTCRLKRINT